MTLQSSILVHQPVLAADGAVNILLSFNHCDDHLEVFYGLDSMTGSGRNYQRLTCMEMKWLTLQHERHLSVDDLDEGIKGCLMLTQPLPLVERVPTLPEN